MIFPLCRNDRVKNSLSNLIRQNRLPHAMLIEGNTGTGKRTLARFIATAALCNEPNPPCGVCKTCHLASVGTHPDIDITAPEEKKKNISVDQIDRIREIAYLTPHTASGKVLIIEHADTMNSASQNKLLKVLEEPPQNVRFILLAESSNTLLETVVSRCTVFSLSEPDFDSAISYLCVKGYDRENAADMLRANNNNIGKTLESLGSSKISLGIEVARDFFDAIERGHHLDALKHTVILDKNRGEVTKFTKELKDILIEKVKQSAKLRATKLEYTRMFDTVCEMEDLLITNINLSLFFTALTSKIIGIKTN